MTLTVSNSLYTNSITKTNYILVNSPAGTPGLPDGDILLCQNNSNTLYTIDPVPNATSYEWTLIPDTVGVMTENDTSVIIDWLNNFTGYAGLSVQAFNGCGAGTASPTLTIHLRPFPEIPEAPTGPTSMCQGTLNSTYTTNPATNAESYSWKLEPADAGTIDGSGTTGTVTWDPAFSGTAEVYVRSVNECNESPYSEPIDITINGNPIVNLGNDTTILNTETLLLDAGNPGMSYLWSTGETTQTITVGYIGNLSDTYWVEITNNDCIGNDTIVVFFIDPVGIPEHFGDITLLIAPNPNQGRFNIELTSNKAVTMHLALINSMGTTVYQEDKQTFSGKHILKINIKHLSDGMYTLLIFANKQVITKKIIVQK